MSDLVFEHPFEKAGLGKAPFRFVGIVDLPSPSLAEANPEAYRSALAMIPRDVGCGTCEYCGQAIMVNCIVADATGKRFAVGCDCVMKTGAGRLVSATKKELNARKREKAKIAREAKFEARRAARDAELARQRAANGGKTDQEAARDAAEAARTATRAILTEKNRWIIEVLKNQPGDFCASMARQLGEREFSDLSPKCQSIIEDIFGKAAGRAGSKAYTAAVEAFCNKLKEG